MSASSIEEGMNNKNKYTKSIIVTLSNTKIIKKIIKHKSSHRNLKSNTVFPSTFITSIININKIYSNESLSRRSSYTIFKGPGNITNS